MHKGAFFCLFMRMPQGSFHEPLHKGGPFFVCLRICSRVRFTNPCTKGGLFCLFTHMLQGSFHEPLHKGGPFLFVYAYAPGFVSRTPAQRGAFVLFALRDSSLYWVSLGFFFICLKLYRGVFRNRIRPCIFY